MTNIKRKGEKNMAKMLKRIAPVGIGLLLIILIAVTISLVKTANDRTPAVNNANDLLKEVTLFWKK